MQQGGQALTEGHFEKALDAFKKANKRQHDACFVCLLGIARAEGNLADRSGAWKTTDKALKIASDDAERARAHNLRGLIKLAEVQTQANSSEVRDQVSGGSFELKLNGRQLEKAVQKPLADAEQEYRTAVQLDGSDPGNHAGLARVLFLESRDDDAKLEAQIYLERAPNGPDSKWLRAAVRDPRRARNYFAPDFEVTTMSGEVISLKNLAGKFVVLDFWATWCPPCRASVGELKELTRKYPKDSVVLLSISADQGAKEWRDFIAAKKMDWPQYWDEDGKIRKLFDIQAFPTYIVIDRDGIIRERIKGLNSQETVVHRLRETLQSLAPEKGS